jgi:hypothetical protein
MIVHMKRQQCVMQAKLPYWKQLQFIHGTICQNGWPDDIEDFRESQPSRSFQLLFLAVSNFAVALALRRIREQQTTSNGSLCIGWANSEWRRRIPLYLWRAVLFIYDDIRPIKGAGV